MKRTPLTITIEDTHGLHGNGLSPITLPTNDEGTKLSPTDVMRIRIFRKRLAKRLAKRLLSKPYTRKVQNMHYSHGHDDCLLCLDSGATNTLLKKSSFIRNILRKITLKIKDDVGKSHSSGGSGPANIFVKRLDGKIIQLPSHGDAHYLPSLF